MSKYKTILFDWDGCLADTITLSKLAFNKTGELKGRELSEDDFIAGYGTWDKAATIAGYEKIDEFKQVFSDTFSKRFSEVVLNPNAYKVLETLYENGFKDEVGVVTTSSKHWIPPQMEATGITKFIRHVIGYEDVINVKPDPEPIIKLMEILGGEACDSLLIGDSPKDIKAAIAASVDSIWYYPEVNKKYYTEEETQSISPTYTIQDLIEVLDIVESIKV